MSSIKALHIRLEGFTASFRHPLVISGVQLSTPMPAYSNLLGMMSACAGRVVRPEETRIGFEFYCRAHSQELERKDRWELKGDHLRPVTRKKVPRVLRRRSGDIFEEMPQGIGWRQVYWEPRLDLYITNVELKTIFENPIATPCFGRSQDTAWIKWLREVDLYPSPKGHLGPTLIPYPQPGVAGLPVRLPEWFENSMMGRPRRAGPFGYYQAMMPTAGDLRFEVERDDLFHPSDAKGKNDVIYLHRWLSG